jgi:hypothetical protein
MRGNITRRGKSSWRLKYDVGTAGQRRIAYVTVRGTRKQAEAELAKRLNELARAATSRAQWKPLNRTHTIGSRISPQPRAGRHLWPNMRP